MEDAFRKLRRLLIAQGHHHVIVPENLHAEVLFFLIDLEKRCDVAIDFLERTPHMNPDHRARTIASQETKRERVQIMISKLAANLELGGL